MRIMTTRKLCFYTPDRKESFTTKGQRIIEDCPSWVKEDELFKVAVKAGILTCLVAAPTKNEVAIQEAAPSNAHEAQELAEELAQEAAPTTKRSKKGK